MLWFQAAADHASLEPIQSSPHKLKLGRDTLLALSDRSAHPRFQAGKHALCHGGQHGGRQVWSRSADCGENGSRLRRPHVINTRCGVALKDFDLDGPNHAFASRAEAHERQAQLRAGSGEGGAAAPAALGTQRCVVWILVAKRFNMHPTMRAQVLRSSGKRPGCGSGHLDVPRGADHDELRYCQRSPQTDCVRESAIGILG